MVYTPFIRVFCFIYRVVDNFNIFNWLHLQKREKHEMEMNKDTSDNAFKIV